MFARIMICLVFGFLNLTALGDDCLPGGGGFVTTVTVRPDVAPGDSLVDVWMEGYAEMLHFEVTSYAVNLNNTFQLDVFQKGNQNALLTFRHKGIASADSTITLDLSIHNQLDQGLLEIAARFDMLASHCFMELLEEYLQNYAGASQDCAGDGFDVVMGMVKIWAAKDASERENGLNDLLQAMNNAHYTCTSD